MDVKITDVVLCKFYFSDLKATKKRPVLVLKDNLPHGDFVGLPISSQLNKLLAGEFEIENSMFQFGSIPKKSKLIVRKPFVVSKNVVIKKYGSLHQKNFENYHRLFCEYFGCGCV
jgi:mRNA interferase MazF